MRRGQNRRRGQHSGASEGAPWLLGSGHLSLCPPGALACLWQEQRGRWGAAFPPRGVRGWRCVKRRKAGRGWSRESSRWKLGRDRKAGCAVVATGGRSRPCVDLGLFSTLPCPLRSPSSHSPHPLPRSHLSPPRMWDGPHDTHQIQPTPLKPPQAPSWGPQWTPLTSAVARSRKRQRRRDNEPPRLPRGAGPLGGVAPRRAMPPPGVWSSGISRVPLPLASPFCASSFSLVLFFFPFYTHPQPLEGFSCAGPGPGILSFLWQLLRGLSRAVMGGRDSVMEAITRPCLCFFVTSSDWGC